jgi:hypothetical protein
VVTLPVVLSYLGPLAALTGLKPDSNPIHPIRDRHGWSRIRTCEGNATRFTVWPLWPLGYPPVYFNPLLALEARRSPDEDACRTLYPAELAVRLELTTLGLQNRSSAN